MWFYKGKEYSEIHEESLVGFIYQIIYVGPGENKGKKYIGKKNFFTTKTIKKGKKELAAMTDKRGSKKKILKNESNWKEYKSSNDFLKIQDEKYLKKEILMFCKTKTDLTYYETKLQFVNEVLESDKWLNGNILSKFFSRI